MELIHYRLQTNRSISLDGALRLVKDGAGGFVVAMTDGVYVIPKGFVLIFR